MATNPWAVKHATDEARLGGDPAVALLEYDGVEALECDCGGTAHYKATIGCLKCTTCGTLYWVNGEKL